MKTPKPTSITALEALLPSDGNRNLEDLVVEFIGWAVSLPSGVDFSPLSMQKNTGISASFILGYM